MMVMARAILTQPGDVFPVSNYLHYYQYLYQVKHRKDLVIPPTCAA